MRFEVDLGSGETANYAFSVGSQSPRGFQVRAEEYQTSRESAAGRFSIERGRFSFPPGSAGVEVSDDRLYLVQASGNAHVRPIYDFLSSLEFYNPEPSVMKPNFDNPGPGDVLEADGVNAANVLERIKSESPDISTRILEYMQRILPGLRNIEVENLRDTYKYLQFDQGKPYKFFAEAMSDGTLRALAILIALFQKSAGNTRPSVVCIEEPEAGLHPSAAGILLSALQEASSNVQVIVTSHSSDLLDTYEVETEAVRAVEWESGMTRIGLVDDVTRQSLHARLYSPGELIRMNLVRPQPKLRDSRPADEFVLDEPS